MARVPLKKIVVIGAGGFGREVLDIIDACNSVTPTYDFIGFIVEEKYGKPGTIVNDQPILGGFDWLEKHKKEVYVSCAVGAPQHRRRLIEKSEQLGCKFFNAIHPSVIKTKWLTLGTGVIVAAGTILSNQIVIGNHVHINPGCIVGHDTVFEDFSTVAPGVRISGNVTLKEGCYIGTGANIIEKMTVGSWSVVGAGSTIIKNVPPNSTVVGTPGKVVKERTAGWHLLNVE